MAEFPCMPLFIPSLVTNIWVPSPLRSSSEHLDQQWTRQGKNSLCLMPIFYWEETGSGRRDQWQSNFRRRLNAMEASVGSADAESVYGVRGSLPVWGRKGASLCRDISKEAWVMRKCPQVWDRWGHLRAEGTGKCEGLLAIESAGNWGIHNVQRDSNPVRTEKTKGQSHRVLEATRRSMDRVLTQWIEFLYEFNKVPYRTPLVWINHLQVYIEKEKL